MSEPTEPQDAAPSEAPVAAEAATAQHPPVPPVQPYPPAYAAPGPYPFAPVVKEPWFNPAKRTSILVASLVAGLLLLGGGFVVGIAAGDHHDRRDRGGVSVYGPMNGRGFGPGFGPAYPFPGKGKIHRQPANGAVPTPSSAPSTS